MQKNELMDKMRKESVKRDPMIPRTIRLGSEMDDQLHEFADDNDLDFSVVVRAMLFLGWKEFTGDK